MDFTQYPQEGPHGSPHGDALWRALIAVHLGLPLPLHPPPWRKEHCRVRGCGLELDARGHHRAACSVALGGERTSGSASPRGGALLVGPARRAGFPCTDRDVDIPQHPSAQIGGAQHQHSDIYVDPGTSKTLREEQENRATGTETKTACSAVLPRNYNHRLGSGSGFCKRCRRLVRERRREQFMRT